MVIAKKPNTHTHFIVHFDCEQCGCEFIANEHECAKVVDANGNVVYETNCPFCYQKKLVSDTYSAGWI